MNLFITAFLVFPLMVSGAETGDGSDGTCDVAGLATTQISAARRTYQCTTLTINGNLNVFNGNGAAAGGAPLVIRVQNNVTMNPGITLDLSGQDGVAGDTVNAVKSGGLGGAGGGAGGASNGTALDGLNGVGDGGGIRGRNVVPVTNSYGGGGGGGAYRNRAATEPTEGDDGSGGGGAPGSNGANGTPYGSEATFETTFTGGSGGGAGGGGTSGGTPYTGSSGGGGGGALRIVSGGDVVIEGTINVNGGNGGGDGLTSVSGGGGAGSGGAIWIQAAGQLTISGTATLTAAGGTMGINDLTGFGGDGGEGRIRLDDGDGVIINLGSVSPAAYSTTFSVTTATTGNTAVTARQYSSSISCARVGLESKHSFLGAFITGLLLAILTVTSAGRLKRKVRAYL